MSHVRLPTSFTVLFPIGMLDLRLQLAYSIVHRDRRIRISRIGDFNKRVVRVRRSSCVLLFNPDREKNAKTVHTPFLLTNADHETTMKHLNS